MVRLLYSFSMLFPFLIYPWGRVVNYELPKSDYLPYFVLMMWLLFVYRWVFRREPVRKPDTAESLLLVFALLVGLSTALAVNVHQAVYGAPQRFEGMTVLLCYPCLTFFAYRFIPPERIRSLAVVTVWSGTIAAVYGILQHALLDFLPRSVDKIGYRSSYSFFDNPNFFGSFLVIMLLLALHRWMTAGTRRELVGCGLHAAVLFTAMIDCNTRSAWLGFSAGWLLVLFYTIKYYRTTLLRWCGMTAFFAALFFVANAAEHGHYTQRAGSIATDMKAALIDSNSFAGSSRWYIWKKALPLVPDYFWHGSGPDTFAFVFPHNADELGKYLHNPDIIVDKAHNEYLNMAITLGVPTLLVYLWLLGLIARRCLKTIAQDPLRRPVTVGLLAVAFGYAVQAFFNISVVSVAPYFWLTLGFCLAATRIRIPVEAQVIP